jgi:hypothetical protein
MYADFPVIQWSWASANFDLDFLNSDENPPYPRPREHSITWIGEKPEPRASAAPSFGVIPADWLEKIQIIEARVIPDEPCLLGSYIRLRTQVKSLRALRC